MIAATKRTDEAATTVRTETAGRQPECLCSPCAAAVRKDGQEVNDPAGAYVAAQEEAYQDAQAAAIGA